MLTGALLTAGIVGVVVTGVVAAQLLRQQRARRLVRMLESPRYSHAIELFLHHWDGNSAFRHAVDYLVGQGVRPRAARVNLARLLRAVRATDWASWGIRDERTRAIPLGTSAPDGTAASRSPLPAAPRPRKDRAAAWIGPGFARPS